MKKQEKSKAALAGWLSALAKVAYSDWIEVENM